MIQVTYLDHSGFAVQTDDALLVFDYYRDPSRSVHKILDANPQLPVVFFVSHHHQDHFNNAIFEMAQNHKRAYVLSNDVPAQAIPSTLDVAGMSAGDVIENLPGIARVKAYGSTDAGVSFFVTLSGGKTVFHAGDLNLWHWKDESDPKEVRQAEIAFDKVLHRIAEEVESIDIAFFPVDPRQGKDFGEGAKEFLATIKVEYFFPMHFWGRKDEACGFAKEIPAAVTKVECLGNPGDRVVLDI